MKQAMPPAAGAPAPAPTQPRPTFIPGFLELGGQVAVCVTPADSRDPVLCPDTVTLFSPIGGNSFQHDMLPAQARQMAAALIAAANWIDAQPVPINEQSR